MKTLLIDGNSLINRAFYALPLLSSNDGVYTNAVYGFLKMFYLAVDEYQPDNIVCAFDLKHPTFRHKLYPEYKAGRKSMPEELVPQIPLLKEVLGKIGVFCFENPGFEADDIIGTYARIVGEAGGESVILTGDRDSFQLIDEHTTVWFTKRGISDVNKLTPNNLKEFYGVEPWQVCDLKALMGDSSDNIPGISGVGEKTALNLISKYSSLEGIFANAEEISGKLGEKVRAGKEDAEKSRMLVTINCNVPVEQLGKTAYLPPENQVLAELFNKYQFKSLLSRVHGEEKKFEAKVNDFEQFSLNTKKLAVYFTNEFISVAQSEDEEFKALLSFDLLSLGANEDEIKQKLLPLMLDETIEKYFYSSKSAMHYFDCEIKNIAGDVELAEYLCDTASGDFSFERLSEKYACTQGAAAIFYIFNKQKTAMQNKNLLSLYFDIELPLARVLFNMEKIGFFVSESTLHSIGAELSKKISELTKQIYFLSGKEFNINSTKQLAEVLFVDLSLPARKKTKTGFSTDNDALSDIDHPIIDLILEYRQVQKLKSTYVDGMFPLISAKTGRIHSTFNQAVTSTGRISSTEPNLQNIPVRSELGKNIRRAFLAEKEDYVLLNADYSQIELRVLAHISGDETLKNAFLRGEDIHARTAAEVFGVEINEVTSEMRSRAKAVNFGIVYGISDFGLAKNIKCSRKEAAEFIEKYFKKYPKIKQFMHDSIEFAKHEGYAKTLLNRRREIPDIRAKNFNVRSFGERQAINTPIQGSAADIIKLAMLKTHQFLSDSPYRAKLILQVHDELILEVHKDDAKEVKAKLKEIMENVMELTVPLVADANLGRTWFDLK